MTPARITVARQRPDDMGLRQIILTLDGEPWTALTHGQTATRELAPGPHTLRADNTLVRRELTFTAAPGDTIRFATANREGFGTWLFMILGAPLLYLTLTREPADH
ncbi:MAG: hypothetical protein K8T26_05730 [Lentisphaerae bacterium]|nr:hypothetical protein [Lentisphaerota bacterium]